MIEYRHKYDDQEIVWFFVGVGFKLNIFLSFEEGRKNRQIRDENGR